MRPRRVTGLLAAVVALSLTACGAAPPVADGTTSTGPGATGPAATASEGTDPALVVPLAEVPDPELPVTVATPEGEVTVDDVSRIVPLVGSLSEIVVSLGLGENIVGRDVAATFEQVAELPVVTHGGHDVSVEGVLSLAPTVVLADTATGPPEAIDQLRSAGVPVVVVEEAWTLDDIATRIAAVATALGVPEAGEALVVRTEAEIAAATLPDVAAGVTVGFLYLRGTAGVYLLGGPGSGADQLVDAVGASDAGTASGLTRPFTPLTSEALIDAAPDVLLVMSSGLESVGGVDGLVALPGVAQTPAGRDRRVIAVDDGLLLSFGPRTGAVITLLAERLAAALADDPAGP